MSAVPLAQSRNYPHGRMESGPDWMRIGVGSALIAGALLLLAGKRKTGLAMTATGTTLALLENKEIVREWWESLPGYLDDAQRMLDQAAATIDDLSAKRDKVMGILRR